MKNVIQSWTFVESILPGEVPSFKKNIEGSKFQDRQARKEVNPLTLSQNLWETVHPANQERDAVKFCYYMDCYEQYRLVKLFREFFNSEEEIINKDSKPCYSFSFEVNASGEYIAESLFIPHAQLIIKDIQTMKAIQYHTFIERYNEAKNRVEEAANTIFSNGASPEAIEKLRHTFNEHFGSPLEHSNQISSGYVEIILENKKFPKGAKKFNSFYLNDLQKIMETGTNATLQQFIEGKPLALDIDENKEAIQQILLPDNLPLGRWPSPISHRLSLMQQVAVNQILNGDEKISSVNGPPGTGKTTLLKDVFAQLIVERAIQMTTYEDPTKAFTKIGQLKIEGGNGSFNYNMYKLDEEIAKYSIVVTSSNNGAVENISKDLPTLGEIVRQDEEPNDQERQEEIARSGVDPYTQYHYDQAYAEEVKDLDLFSDLSSELIQGEETWGLFSAALGRSANITAASKALNGLRAKKGQPRLMPLRDRLEQPLPDNAWQEVVHEFNTLRQSVERKKEELQQFAKIMMEVEELIISEEETVVEIEKTEAKQQQIQQDIDVAEKQKQFVNEQLDNLPPPTVWKKFLKLFTEKRSEEEEQIRQQLNQIIEQQKQLALHNNNNTKGLEHLKIKSNKLKQRLAEIEELKEKYNGQEVVLPTKDLWEQKMYEARQRSVLWQTNELNFERSLLFLKALKVQKTFLMKNARSIKAGLAVFSNRQSINLNIDENRKYIENMWNVMHLIFPVISTTFASFSSMYKGIGKDFIGYLFVDEAGQASPQQAAGALWRTKRAIIVGDPIQIEPVVTLDDTILHDVREAFQVSDAYIGPTASVQTLADFANPIGTYKGEGENRQRIGIPLWVHRRCIEPMFSIANRIAYDNKMVLATKKIGKGYWYDCTGNAVQAQYVQEQGEFIAEQIEEHFDKYEGEGEPSIFVITPFTAVKDGLKNVLKQWLKGEIPNFNKWLDRSIGTVHTFQGKEADIVYFVTGTDIETDGAANWSCQKPNLLNVAVTRAKKEFYVVGDLERFRSKQHYNIIDQAFEEFKEKKSKEERFKVKQ